MIVAQYIFYDVYSHMSQYIASVPGHHLALALSPRMSVHVIVVRPRKASYVPL